MSRIDVCWSPINYNQFFLVQNNELALYKLDRSQSLADNSALLASDSSTSATLLTKNSLAEVAFLKTFACYPNKEHENLVAVGQANGRVLLTSPVAASNYNDPWLGREFVPKHSRSCLSLAWNPKNPQYLAVGMDRYRTDSTVFVYDVVSKSTHSMESVPSSNSVAEYPSLSTSSAVDHRRLQSGTDYGPGPPAATGSSSSTHHSRALHEFAPSESALSLVWFRENPRLLACGLSEKYIRLFDMRDSSRPQTSILTKAVYGLVLDPFSDNRLCSYHDNQLLLWDMRHNDKPLLSIREQKPILKVQWDPVRRNVITSLCKDSSMIRLFNLQQIQMAAEESELSFVETYIQPRFESNATSIATYAWHPLDENRLLTIGVNMEFSYEWVCQRLCIDWNCDGNLIAAFPKRFDEFTNLKLTEFNGKFDEDDVSWTMRRRAIQGYGTSDTTSIFKRAADVCKDDLDLHWLWGWLEKMKNVSSEDTETWLYDVKYPGALTIIKMPYGRGPSSTEYRSIFGLDSSVHSVMTKLYVSPERDRLLQLCGWGSMIKERPSTNDPLIQKLIGEGEIERAAAMALFTLRLKLAVQILTNASGTEAKKHLHLVALSLAGYPGSSEKEATYLGPGPSLTNSQNPSLWLELCNSILSNIDNPYLKAMFLFLSSKCNSSNSYDGVLDLPDLPVYDKIAFAAVHLSDSTMVEFFERLYRHCLSTSNLLGSIICGFSCDETLQLVDSYIDRTGDVQTAALILIATGPNRLIQDSVSAAAAPDQQQQQQQQTALPLARPYNLKRVDEIVEAYLNLLNRWCLWHVRAETETLFSKTDDRNVGKIAPQVYLTCTFCSKSVWSGSGRPRQRMNKLGSCPNCKKPLPRCSLCRFHMGVPLHKEESKFGTWFSWCQTCRHGGHAQHLTEWFQEHDECPVTGCSCKCASLDSSCGTPLY